MFAAGPAELLHFNLVFFAFSARIVVILIFAIGASQNVGNSFSHNSFLVSREAYLVSLKSFSSSRASHFTSNASRSLRNDLCHDASADGMSTFSNGKANPLLHRNRRDQLRLKLDIVPRHHHLYPGLQRHRSRHITRPKIKLRPIPLEKR